MLEGTALAAGSTPLITRTRKRLFWTAALCGAAGYSVIGVQDYYEFQLSNIASEWLHTLAGFLCSFSAIGLLCVLFVGTKKES